MHLQQFYHSLRDKIMYLRPTFPTILFNLLNSALSVSLMVLPLLHRLIHKLLSYPFCPLCFSWGISWGLDEAYRF